MKLSAPLPTLARVFVLGLLLLPLWFNRPDDHRAAPQNTAPASEGRTALPPATPPPVAADSFADQLGQGLAYPATPLLRPLAVARASDHHEWTAGDGFAPEVIHRLAHNPAEFRRLIEENDRILARQLVYRKEPVATRLQAARASGEILRQLTLPGLDGQELVVELTGADLAPSFLRGTFHGKLAGRPQSMVTLAFKGGREAFTVLSPEDDLYLQADPREPGELIVKRIDPDTYVVGKCGTE